MTHTPPLRDPLSPLPTLHASYPCLPILRRRHNNNHAFDQQLGLYRAAARRPTPPLAASAAGRPHRQPPVSPAASASGGLCRRPCLLPETRATDHRHRQPRPPLCASLGSGPRRRQPPPAAGPAELRAHRRPLMPPSASFCRIRPLPSLASSPAPGQRFKVLSLGSEGGAERE